MNRFWSKVQIGNPDECWIWTAARNRSSKFLYGRFGFRGRNFHAHRVAWILENGEIPEGMCALHKCDNPPCVNPNHLFIGTRGDNIRDMESKKRGRHPNLQDNKRAKITNDQALEIRIRGQAGERRCALAKEFGLSAVAVSYICNGKSWKGLSV